MNKLFDDSPLGNASVKKGKIDVAYCHRMECKACTLASEPNLNPNMPATGSDKPTVYILAEAPGKTEDEENEQLVGESGQLVRARIPRDFRGEVRFNNVVRTRPPKNRDPSPLEIECCRPSIVADIEETKPKAIAGFGYIALEWAIGEPLQKISMWRGRRVPIKVGNHTCWFYPIMHPSFILHNRGRRRDAPPDVICSEEERMFALDFQRVFDEVDDLPKPEVHTVKDVWSGVKVVKTLDEVFAALAWAMKQPAVGIDYETNMLRPYDKDARILTAAVGTGDTAYAFPINHPDHQWEGEDYADVCGAWLDFLHNYKGKKYVHNLAFELEWTAVQFKDTDVVRAGRWEDTSVQASVLDERKGDYKPGTFSLEFLVLEHFGINIKKLTNLDKAKLAEEPLDLVARYNGGDAKYHYLLGEKQAAIIKAEGLEDVYYRDSLRRVPTVVLSQIKGVPVDNGETAVLQKKYSDRKDDLLKQIAKLPVVKQFEKQQHRKYNPLSTEDALVVFVDMLKREECSVYDKKKKKDRYSVDEEVLGQIKHPLADLTVKLRKASKQKSTYIDPLDPANAKTVVYDDGLLHATFNTIFARSGRLSCDSPNLQNFPKRDGEAKEVRRQIKAPKGHVVLAVDYGQIEARVIAMFTKDKVFCKALWENFDVHEEWAARLARAYPARVGGRENFTDKKVMKDFRTDIKNQWTFPLFFGASLTSAAGYLEIPEDKLRPEYEEFWRVFAGVKEWQERQLKSYQKVGFVSCLTGRRRHGPLSTNQVYNSPVQGTAAEIVMDGMCRLSETREWELQPEINIHDDLTYLRVPVDKVDDIAEKVIGAMLDVPYDFVNVPIAVEAAIGDNWLELEEFGRFFSHTWFKDGGGPHGGKKEAK